MIKKILRKFTIKKVSNYINYHIGKTITYLDWVRKGKLVPPPSFIKEDTIKKYAKRFKPRVFVETGTYYGEMINAVKYLFSRVISVELDRELYEKSKERFKDYPNIEIFNGDSSDILLKILPQIKETILFWLDAHFCSLNTAGGGMSCPLIDELDVIHSYKGDKYIFIDDARLFLSPPPKPHPIDEYPIIWDVLKKLQSESSNYVVIFEDVIISVPSHARSLVEQYCQDKNTYYDKLFWDEKMKNDFKIAYEYFKKGIVKFLKQKSLLLR